MNYVDAWGLAPRNLSDEERQKYMEYISSFNLEDAPDGLVCSIFGAYLYTGGMEAATGEKDAYKNLTHNGKNLTHYTGIYAEDYVNGTGPFLGWGEIGKDSATINDTKLQQQKGDSSGKKNK